MLLKVHFIYSACSINTEKHKYIVTHTAGAPGAAVYVKAPGPTRRTMKNEYSKTDTYNKQ